MLSRCMIVVAVVALFLSPVLVSAQFVNVGDPDMRYADMTSGGLPTTLKITGLSDIPDYPFDGSDLEIPFTLEGSGATVWLIIYTVDQHPPLTIEGEGPGPYADAEHATPGWHVYDDVDLLVYRSAGERFGEGENVIVWNGRDLEGNTVPVGRYDLFLAAFDDEGIPHVVGQAGAALGSAGQQFIDVEKGLLYAPGARVDNMANDWIENPLGSDQFDQSALVDGDGNAYVPATGVPLNAERTEWIGNIYDGSGNGRIVRFRLDWDAMQAIPVEDWGLDAGAVNGVLTTGGQLPARQYTSATSPEKDVVYLTAGVSGTVAKLVGWNIATGELAPGKNWDFSDIFMYDNKGSDRVAGLHDLSKFYDGEADPYGLTTTCHHSSVIARFDYDGNVRWINRNGDYYGDLVEYNQADGTFGDLIYGHTETPGFKYHVYSSKWGWTSYCMAGLDNINYGFMLGEDGSGLFFFQPKHIPLTWPTHVIVVDAGDGDWDGVYLSVGAYGEQRAANDFDHKPMVHLPYDHKRVTLGAAQAVELTEVSSQPTDYSLGNAYPNPFNPETTIRFSLPMEVQVTVKIYNAEGQFVRDLVNDRLGPGQFTITWDGTDAYGATLSSGVYLYKIETPGLKMSKRVTFLK